MLCLLQCVLPVKADINNQTLAIIVNTNDPESVEIAKYYQQSRLIPDSNIINIKFRNNANALTQKEFENIQVQLNRKLTGNIQALALAWRKPWRVDCMSITSAFSLGYSKEYCANDCKLTKAVTYFNSKSKQPFTDYKIRPSMLLSASSVNAVKKLIDRGVSADYSRPVGSAYLLNTSDKNRNVRAVYFSRIKRMFSKVLGIEVINADAIKNLSKVMFYFTGVKNVKWVNDNNYLPGAVADHLTSSGGYLFGSNQMSVLKWIDAGVTGTYGTVVEPCAFVQKFPRPSILMKKYLSGETLLEAYWKSVEMPGQGVFVGEPLAAPYKGCRLFANKKGFYQYLNFNTENYIERRSTNCN